MKADPPSTTATHVGRQFETKGERGKQDLAKADTPSSTPTHVGKQLETRGDKTSGRRTHHPTKGNHKGRREGTPTHTHHPIQETMGNKQGRGYNCIRPRKGGRPIPQGHTRRETVEQSQTVGNKVQEGGNDIEQRIRKGVQWETRGNKTLGKAEIPSNKRNQKGRQWETREKKGR